MKENLVAEFEYDVFGRRIWKNDITAGKTTCYWYNNKWQVLSESDAATDAFERRYVYGNYIDETLLMADATNEYYYAHDHLYSTAALTDATGGVVERYEYEAYGQPTVYTNMSDWDTASPTTAAASNYGNPYMFTGRRVDTLDGGDLTLQYNRHRYYDYETGRWLSQDPQEYINGVNMYQYVASSPLGGLDCYGLWGDAIHGDLVRELAKLAGASAECARKMAEGTLQPDIAWDPPAIAEAFAATNFAYWFDQTGILPFDIFDVSDEQRATVEEMWAMARALHFPVDSDGYVRPNSDASRVGMDNGIKGCDLHEFTEGLHTFQDSWAHQGKPVGELGIGHSRAVKKIVHNEYEWQWVNWWVGYTRVRTKTWTEYVLVEGVAAIPYHNTDSPWYWPEDARDTGQNTYNKILEFMKNCPCECGSSGNENRGQSPILEQINR
ncbi:MAG: RHS repeat-associated core domain-containing protein [Phycisphaerae bacterium]|nr:RHS repeat-associated core domain-containing protein [Phycisphaerae bacterium]